MDPHQHRQPGSTGIWGPDVDGEPLRAGGGSSRTEWPRLRRWRLELRRVPYPVPGQSRLRCSETQNTDRRLSEGNAQEDREPFRRPSAHRATGCAYLHTDVGHRRLPPKSGCIRAPDPLSFPRYSWRKRCQTNGLDLSFLAKGFFCAFIPAPLQCGGWHRLCWVANGWSATQHVSAQRYTALKSLLRRSLFCS